MTIQATDTSVLESLVPAALVELDADNPNGPNVEQLAKGLLQILSGFLGARWSGLGDVELIASESLSIALAKLHTWDRNAGSLRGWVVGIGRRRAVSAWRTQQTDQDEKPNSYDDDHRSRFFLQTRPDTELHDALLETLLSFSESESYLLHLIMVERNSAAEAARMVNITPALARKKKERMLKALQKVLSMHPQETRLHPLISLTNPIATHHDPILEQPLPQRGSRHG